MTIVVLVGIVGALSLETTYGVPGILGTGTYYCDSGAPETGDRHKSSRIIPLPVMTTAIFGTGTYYCRASFRSLIPPHSTEIGDCPSVPKKN
jgi:hypothetical protein